MTRAPLTSLTHKHKIFVSTYLTERDSHAAARAAGYSVNMANKILSLPLVQAEIERCERKVLKQVVTDKVWVSEKLQRIVESSIDEEKDIAIKALAELNKMYGNYAPIQTENKNLNVTYEITDEIAAIRESYLREI